MQKSSSLLAVCIIVALTLSIPRTQHLAPPEAPPPAASGEIMIGGESVRTDDFRPTDELDYILPEDQTAQPRSFSE